MDNEKIKRVKYIRALEKFASYAVKSVKRDDFDWDKFKLSLNKNTENLSKIEPVFLDQPYTKALEEFVNIALNSNSKSEISRAANALDKFKKAKNYKKEKYKNSVFDY